VMERLQGVLETLFRAPKTMNPEELAERVEVLESRVETNRVALAQHESDSARHLGSDTNDR
jgi:hypothetical protein